jgi:hypothetical protein
VDFINYGKRIINDKKMRGRELEKMNIEQTERRTLNVQRPTSNENQTSNSEPSTTPWFSFHAIVQFLSSSFDTRNEYHS